MVSKNQIKLINGLRQKKMRDSERLFFAEGVKVITELLQSGIELTQLYSAGRHFDAVPPSKITMISEAELKKISALTTPNDCLAVFRIPEETAVENAGLIVVLDDIRDPGNLGTIIRLCDWFGVRQIVCSRETADLYIPKVVQATMGSIARVRVTYTNLPEFIKNSNLPVFGTFMDGSNIYDQQLPADGIVIFGNEANGISAEVEKAVKNKLAIPRFGDLQLTESLNVASAVAIVLSEFRR